MVINKGDEFLDLKTGIVYRVYFESRHKLMVCLSSRKGGEGDFILNTNPVKKEDIVAKLKVLEWIPNTPAGRTLYGFKD